MYKSADICVVGGGPAGSTIARRLACLGYKVILLEQKTFPRRRIGESLAPSILPQLELLGLRAIVEKAGFFRPTASITRWVSDLPERINHSGEPGFHVDRAQFESLLLDSAIAAGVEVLRPVSVYRKNLYQEDGTWFIETTIKGHPYRIRFSFLVDATGRSSWLIPGRKNRYSEPTIALYAYWHDTGIEGVEPRVDVSDECWYWAAPLPDGTTNIAIFLDARFTSFSLKNKRAFYQMMLSKSPLLHTCLRGKVIEEIQCCCASSFYEDYPIGENFIKVGEAAFSIDPLSSQGIQTAIVSALQGSCAINTIFVHPEYKDAAREFYQARVQEVVMRNQMIAASYYAERNRRNPTPFWDKRAKSFLERKPSSSPVLQRLSLDSQLKLSDKIVWKTIPILEGDIIVPKKALQHPSLKRSIAFLGGISIESLLVFCKNEVCVKEIIHDWYHKIGLSYQQSENILYWLLNQQLLLLQH